MKKVFLGILYWIWQLTWGGLMTIPGLLVTAFCIVFLKGKPHKNGFSYIVEIGGDWGGLEIGAVALCGSYAQKDGPCYCLNWFDHTRIHEFGHSLQQLIFGPLQLFLVWIPSAIRYNYRNWCDKHGKPLTTAYDDIWFEGQATDWGTAFMAWYEKDK